MLSTGAAHILKAEENAQYKCGVRGSEGCICRNVQALRSCVIPAGNCRVAEMSSVPSMTCIARVAERCSILLLLTD